MGLSLLCFTPGMDMGLDILFSCAMDVLNGFFGI